MLQDAANPYGLNHVTLRYFNVAKADARGRGGQGRSECDALDQGRLRRQPANVRVSRFFVPTTFRQMVPAAANIFMFRISWRLTWPPSISRGPFKPLWFSHARLRDELLDGEISYTLKEAQIVIESWRRHYNAVRPHASLGYRPPAPEVFVPAFAAWRRANFAFQE